MSLYAQYTKEREGFETIESEHAFIDYKIFGEECYVRNVYIVPEKRQSGIASQLCKQVEDIAKSKGCKCLTGTTVPSTVNSTKSAAFLLQYGFEILRSEADKIIFIKRLE